MAYLTESSTWRDRRRRRQQITMTVIVLVVVVTGVGAYAFSQGWLGDPKDDVTVTALPTCPPASTSPLTAAGVHVNVYNTTSRNGLAATVATALAKRSFGIGTVANDPLHANVTGTALVRYGSKGVEAAKLVMAQVPKATMRHDKRKGTDVDLVLGDAFRRLAPAAVPTTAASPSPSARCTPASTSTSGTSSPTSGTSSPTNTGTPTS